MPDNAVSLPNSDQAPKGGDGSGGFTFRIARVQEWTLGAIITACVGFGFWMGTLNSKLEHIEKFVDSGEDPANGIFVRLSTIQKSIDLLERSGNSPVQGQQPTESTLDQFAKGFEFYWMGSTGGARDLNAADEKPGNSNASPKATTEGANDSSPEYASAEDRVLLDLVEYQRIQQSLASIPQPNSSPPLPDRTAELETAARTKAIDDYKDFVSNQINEIDDQVSRMKLSKSQRTELADLIKKVRSDLATMK